MSALIWLGIVAVWGFVLIPMWLRHHDNTLEQRSAERFTTAMRVLSRRGAQRSAERSAVDGTDGLDGSRPQVGADDLTGAPPIPTQAPGVRPRPAPRSGPRTAPEAARAALVRARRQRLLVLLGAVPASLLVAVIAGGMWFVVQVIVDAGLVGYVGYLRHAAKMDARLRASRAARDRQIAQDRAARASAWRSGANPALLSRPPSEPARSAAERGVHFSSIPSGSSAAGGSRIRDHRVRSAEAGTRDAAEPRLGLGHGERSGYDDGYDHDERYEHSVSVSVADDVTSDETVDLSDVVATANRVAGYEDDYRGAGYDHAGDHEDQHSDEYSHQDEYSGTGYRDDAGYDHDVEYGTGYDADPDRVIEASDVEAAGFSAGHEVAGDEVGGHEVAMHDEDGFEPADGWAADEDDDPSAVTEEPGVSEPYRGSSGRSGGRSGRPTTSKPGRVQVNPPGTHGGLTPPPGGEAAPPAASAERPRGDEGDDLEELLSRHAAGA
ncbi:MAG: hypothetical protein ACQSGP_22390 [Frankia sp.]